MNLWRSGIAGVLAAVLAGSIASAAEPPVPLYLPIISRGPAGCTPLAQEAAFAEFMRTTPLQQRPSMTCHPLLEQVARERAQDMAAHNYFSHVNRDGFGPNYLVIQAGYTLPAWWNVSENPDSNYIESIAAGNDTAAASWQQLLNSPSHREHMLGASAFDREQIFYGIGYANDPDSDYGDYWVVITAPPQP